LGINFHSSEKKSTIISSGECIMLKRLFPICLLLILTLFTLPAFEAGGGFSVYVPQSLYEQGNGSVSLEQSLEFDLGLSKMLSIPIGITYNTNYGLTVTGEPDAKSPWFYSDSILPYIMLKIHIPAGPFYAEIFGGGGANYNFTLRPLEGNIEKDLSTEGQQAVFKDGTLEYEKSWGFGYLAGVGVGIKIDQISVEITALYRNIEHDLNLKADYASISQVGAGTTYDPGESTKLLMRGVSFGIAGSFAF
jgi:hypothetical protein